MSIVARSPRHQWCNALAHLSHHLARLRSLRSSLDLLVKVREVMLAHVYLRRCARGSLVRVVGRPFLRIGSGGKIILGERVRIISQITRAELAVGPGARLEIGARTFLNYGCSLGATRLIRIGERCLIGNYVTVIDNNFHDVRDRSRMPEPQAVIIEDDVWLGTRAIVLPGVHIGRGAVVGAASVVTEDVPAWCVVAGTPARIIRRLAPTETDSVSLRAEHVHE